MYVHALHMYSYMPTSIGYIICYFWTYTESTGMWFQLWHIHTGGEAINMSYSGTWDVISRDTIMFTRALFTSVIGLSNLYAHAHTNIVVSMPIAVLPVPATGGVSLQFTATVALHWITMFYDGNCYDQQFFQYAGYYFVATATLPPAVFVDDDSCEQSRFSFFIYLEYLLLLP